jgi:ribosomal protein S14
MAYNLKEVANRPERFASGHRMCARCGSPVVVRGVLRALHPKIKRSSPPRHAAGGFLLHVSVHVVE